MMDIVRIAGRGVDRILIDELSKMLTEQASSQVSQAIEDIKIHGSGAIFVGPDEFSCVAYNDIKLIVPQETHDKMVDLGLIHRDSETVVPFKLGRDRLINVGAIGHVDYGKTSLNKAIDTALKARTNKSDRKRDRANRWR